MRKSVASVSQNDRIGHSSQRKRLRSTSPMREEENSVTNFSQKKVKKTANQYLREKNSELIGNGDEGAGALLSLPSGSSISVSSSSNRASSRDGKTSTGEKSTTRTESNGKENICQRAFNDSNNKKR